MEIAPLDQGFGARVTGFDLERGGTASEISALQAAFDQYHLLIIAGAGVICGERHAEIASWFGPVGANRDADGRLWTYLDNRDTVGRNELKFHSDISFMPEPFLGLSLHPVALPEGVTETSFISTALGWDALDQDLCDLLANRNVKHEFLDESTVSDAFQNLHSWHPARMAHPRSGRPVLFVSENNVREIEGFGREASAPLLERIFATLYAPERRYDHRWQAGDFLVWDNRTLQHARPKVADPADGPRVMQRVALGTLSFAEQFEARRPAMA
ncbi:MAG: TauD/TfdA dioxygenase family protein [Novosphingobium sp.]